LRETITSFYGSLLSLLAGENGGRMNKIKVGRLLASGLITLLAFVVVEIVVEKVVGNSLLGLDYDNWYGDLIIPKWTVGNYVLNIFFALVNSTVLMWLYAALRPMFGVGARTALITSGFAFTFVATYAINQANLGIVPIWIAYIEMVYIIIELPLALLVGSWFYEAG
jgi:hypothetical protein